MSIAKQDSHQFNNAEEVLSFYNKTQNLPDKITFNLVAMAKATRPAWDDFLRCLKQSSVTHITLSSLYSDPYSKLNLKRWSEFCRALTASQVQSLNFVYLGLGNDCEEFWQSLSDCIAGSHLKELNFARNRLANLSANNWKKLAKALIRSSVISLNMSGNTLYQVSDRRIIPGYVYDTPLEQSNWERLCSIIANGQLQDLKLNEENFKMVSADAWGKLCQAIGQSTLQSLEISLESEPISEQRWLTLLNAIRQIELRSLKITYFGRDELTNAVLNALSSLMKQGKLESLSLSSRYGQTNLTPNQWAIFSDGIQHSRLNSLRIHLPTPDCWLHYMACLANSNIEKLDLGARYINSITAEQWTMLLDQINNNKIKALTLDGSGFVYMFHNDADNIAKQIAFLNLLQNATLTTLTLDNLSLRQLDSHAVEQLFNAIKQSQIKKLNFYADIALTDDTALMLLNTLRDSKISVFDTNLNDANIDKMNNILRRKNTDTLFKTCSYLLFNEYNANLKQGELTYHTNESEYVAALDEKEIEVLLQARASLP